MALNGPLTRRLFLALDHAASLTRSAQFTPVSEQCHQILFRSRRKPFTPCHRHLRRAIHTSPRHSQQQYQNPADDPNFKSLLDEPPRLIRSSRRHGPGLIILAIIPLTAFALGTWQVRRLAWKSDLIARFEDRLVREPLPLPPRLDPDAVPDFDYRRVEARGRFRHDREMLVGPRVLDGADGFQVVTPLERGEGGCTVLINRGWIAKALAPQAERRRRQAGGAKIDGVEALPEGEVVVRGLLREPARKNMFTPANASASGKWYFPDVAEMAEWAGAEPVWVEETMAPDLIESYNRESRGVPIGRLAAVNLRNNHAQYIFTW